MELETTFDLELTPRTSRSAPAWFLKVRYASPVVREGEAPYGPWDRAPWNGDVEVYREDLYGGMAFGLLDLLAFAQECPEELARVGYRGTKGPLAQPAG